MLTYRGLTNLGCLVFLAVGLVALLYVPIVPFYPHLHPFSSAGYPMISYFTKHPLSYAGGFNLGGINASGQESSTILYLLLT